MVTTGSYNRLCSHRFVEDLGEEWPELSSNPDWRGIMIRARNDHGLSQTELGRRVGTLMGTEPFSQAMISKIESGASTSSRLIKPICQVLSIPLPQHFVDEDDRAWSQLGHVLRRLDPDQYKLLLAQVEFAAERAEQAKSNPDQPANPVTKPNE